jgi:hypothetical protein
MRQGRPRARHSEHHNPRCLGGHNSDLQRMLGRTRPRFTSPQVAIATLGVLDGRRVRVRSRLAGAHADRRSHVSQLAAPGQRHRDSARLCGGRRGLAPVRGSHRRAPSIATSRPARCGRNGCGRGDGVLRAATGIFRWEPYVMRCATTPGDCLTYPATDATSAPRRIRALIPAPAARAGMRSHGFG